MISDQGGEDASDGGKCLTFLCVCVCALGGGESCRTVEFHGGG